MATVSAAAVLARSAVEEAASWYTTLPPALRSVQPLALREALILAGGDIHRLWTDGDGAVVVANRPVW